MRAHTSIVVSYSRDKQLTPYSLRVDRLNKKIKLASYDQFLNLTRRVPYSDPHSHFRKRTLSVLPPINYAPYGRTSDGRKPKRCGGGGNNTRTMTGHFIWLCPLRRLWLIIFTDIRRAPAPRIRFPIPLCSHCLSVYLHAINIRRCTFYTTDWGKSVGKKTA